MSGGVVIHECCCEPVGGPEACCFAGFVCADEFTAQQCLDFGGVPLGHPVCDPDPIDGDCMFNTTCDCTGPPGPKLTDVGYVLQGIGDAGCCGGSLNGSPSGLMHRDNPDVSCAFNFVSGNLGPWPVTGCMPGETVQCCTMDLVGAFQIAPPNPPGIWVLEPTSGCCPDFVKTCQAGPVHSPVGAYQRVDGSNCFPPPYVSPGGATVS